ncbi:MAG: phosphoribosyl-AMP cyclohydrolase / phosphoribosyl-ATP pyrophosphohydrolase [Acidobacteriota bacterium]|jgi:phosphoribosyl-ATP pyrophosphohydrolase/phosphoribosyl-AMP cyclohydrolase|nr:phosphoribosyl-AMP cyclohydrolase / phosphoribosyl-ATP pyrophosphohydrolase [Acidobacteriota bacterium]
MLDVNFNNGLIAAIVRDSATGATLMLAWMNDEALRRTEESGETWFWSRSRGELWNKGATSGNRQKVVAIKIDCDRDALLIDVIPAGPACHTGAYSCFDDRGSQLDALMHVLRQRSADRPDGSYSTYLFNAGIDKILKKVGEEASEVIIAAKGDDNGRVVSEVADLVYHLSVLLVEKELDWSAVNAELRRRSDAH